MELSVKLYLGLLAAVAFGRLVELCISRRNQLRLLAMGARKIKDSGYPWMVALHVAVLAGSAFEVTYLWRPLVPPLAAVSLVVFVSANVVRWWVIRTLASHWNTQVVASSQLGVVTGGPYRWIRHPNYSAVFLEMAALPLVHSAWLTALVGTVAHIAVLRHRVLVEESVLLADPAYRAAFQGKPRFLPFLRRQRQARVGWTA